MTDGMKIYLIRHGSTAGNLKKRYVGNTDEPLTEESVHTLQENRACYPRADAVFVSPQKRCISTADILYPEVRHQILPDLREIDFGAFEYQNAEDLKEDPRYRAWIDSGGTLPFPGGESREAFCGRCTAAFEEACEKTEGQSAAFVVHGGTIMAILDRFSEPHRDYYEWQTGNGEGFACEAVRRQTDAGPVLRLRGAAPLPKAPALTGIEGESVYKQQKSLHSGYTTGSCAAAAAQAAAEMLLTGRLCCRADLLTLKGIRLHLPVEEQEITGTYASCAVRKYAGDDPDVTDQALICARVEYSDAPQIEIDGGAGVGRVTKPGLEQGIGEAAINRVPRKMIEAEVQNVCEDCEYTGGLKVTISVPAGAEIAKRTFNPHLGIEGGISILGTSGIEEPMSERALLQSIRVEMRQRAANREEYLLITPGSCGEEFIRRLSLDGAGDADTGRFAFLHAEDSMKCSNYVGEMLDMAAEFGVKGILFIAHIGKFIKVSGGIMNTHSAQADCRAELMAAQAMRSGAPEEIVRKILSTNTSEEAVGILKESSCLKQTMAEVTRRVKEQLQKRCSGALATEAVLYSNQYGYLGETDGARALAEKIAEQS